MPGSNVTLYPYRTMMKIVHVRNHSINITLADDTMLHIITDSDDDIHQLGWLYDSLCDTM